MDRTNDPQLTASTALDSAAASGAVASEIPASAVEPDRDPRRFPRVALVTGGGSGIGAEVALQLAATGVDVVITGRRVDALDAVAEQHPFVHAMAADVTEETSVKGLFVGIEEDFGRLDVLINNAGTFGSSARLDEFDLDVWRQVLDVNLTGAMLCSREAMRLMGRQRPRGGRIVNNGSLAAQAPRPHTAAYAASKAGLTGLTRATALDGRELGVTCGQVDIGNAATDLLAATGALDGALQPDGSIRREPSFSVDDAARAIVLMATMPPEAVIDHLTITASGMPYQGRG